MPKPYLPIGKAAEYLSLSVDTLRRWEKAGKISSTCLDGKNRYFALKDLDLIKFGNFVDINEAAKRLGVSTSTLRRLADKNIIPAGREINGFRKFKVKDLEKYLDSQTNLAHEAQKIQVESPSDLQPKISLPHPKSTSNPILTYIYQNLKNMVFFWRILWTTLFILLLTFLFISSAILFSFILKPKDAAKFFQFKIKTSKTSLLMPLSSNILGASSKAIEGNEAVLGIASTILQPQAATTVKILRIINPSTVEGIILPGEELIYPNLGLAGATGSIGMTGTAGPGGPAGPGGANGTLGLKGDTGTNGSNGSAGSAGSAGPVGATGATGSW